MEKLLSIEDVAEILGLEYKTIYKLVKAGEIPSARIGKVYRISKEDLSAYLEQQKQVVQKEASRTQHIANKDIRCGGCGSKIVSELGIAGRCQVCDSVLCDECFGIRKTKFCSIHEPKTEQ